MKLRMILHQAYYTYTSHNCHFTTGETWGKFYIDFESDNASLIFDKISFFEPTCIDLGYKHISNAVLLYKDQYTNTPKWTFDSLVHTLNFQGADEHYLYWWSIKRIG